MNRQIVSAILLCWALSTVFAQEKADSLRALSSIYEKRSADLQVACDTRTKAALDQYANALTELHTAMTEGSDSAGVAAILREKTRLASEKTLPETAPADIPPQVESARSACRKAIAAARDDKNRRLAELTRFYVDHLSALQKTLTSENKIEEATRVNDEVKRATSLMADALSKIEPTEPDDTATPPKVCPRCNGQKALVEDCSLCNGTGKCPGCGGTGRDPARSSLRHALCGGTGKCKKCTGLGKLKSQCPLCIQYPVFATP
ncbi:MAG: hypothetical protein QME60_04520 [Verrucomicrobiota bacterium]|nr:hypothetical protein [Verrucomicrobiota bacterium]